MENLEELKNKYEGNQMIAKREDMFGVKKKITIHSLVIINDNGKEIINCSYSWNIGESLGNMSIEKLLSNYELKQQI
jgi:hypothetical protein